MESKSDLLYPQILGIPQYMGMHVGMMGMVGMVGMWLLMYAVHATQLACHNRCRHRCLYPVRPRWKAEGVLYGPPQTTNKARKTQLLNNK